MQQFFSRCFRYIFYTVVCVHKVTESNAYVFAMRFFVITEIEFKIYLCAYILSVSLHCAAEFKTFLLLPNSFLGIIACRGTPETKSIFLRPDTEIV